MKITGISGSKKIKDLVVYGFGQAVNLLSPLIVMPYLISICGESGLGRIGVGFSMALILSGIVDYGSYIKGVKEISINRDNHAVVRERLQGIYLSKFLLLLAVVSASTLLILVVPFFARDKVLFFLSLTMVVGQFINPAWYFQATENFKWISAINILSKAIYVGCIFAFIRKKEDYVLANLFFGMGAIAANLIGFWHLSRKFRLSLSDLSWQPAFAILRGEFSFTVSQFFLSVYQFFPIMVISYLGGDFMAGQYRVIDQIISIFKSYLNIFFYFVYANICYEINKNLKQGLQVWKTYNGLNFVFVLLLAAAFFINAELVFAYFKISPAQIPDISRYFRIGLTIPVLIALSQPLRQLMFAFDKNRIYIIITILATTVNVGLLLALTSFYGLPGALFSIIIIEVIVIVLYVSILNGILRQTSKTIQ